MAHATGTRLIAAVFMFVSFIPPWVQAVVTLPIGLALWRAAATKEQERKDELAALTNS